MRTFTLAEAETLLPALDALLRRAQAAAEVVNGREEQLQSLSQAILLSGGLAVDLQRVSRLRAEHDCALEEARGLLQQIEETGASLRELERGLLEFPFLLDGSVVMLCWLQGESTITQWHAEEQSYDERQPIDERFTRGERPH